MKLDAQRPARPLPCSAVRPIDLSVIHCFSGAAQNDTVEIAHERAMVATIIVRS